VSVPGVPFAPDPVRIRAEATVLGSAITVTLPATYQGLDSRSGEFRRPVRVVPAITLALQPGLAVLPLQQTAQPLRISVVASAENGSPISGILRLAAPEGWRIEPAEIPLDFGAEGGEHLIEFTVIAPDDLGPGRTEIDATFTDSAGRTFSSGYTLVDYPHIHPRALYRNARLDVRMVDVEVPAGLNVAYIAAPGDNVPSALSQLGITLTPLTPDDLAATPLRGYDVIVVGNRAYEGRPDLVAYNQRILDYAQAGGTVIVQYNQYEFTEPGIAPYPVSMARPHDRVTDETAAVRLLVPDHPIFNVPNRIGPADFEGWVQERGLYYLNTWDERYRPLLEMADPGEPPVRGAMLVTNYGEGIYVYTGLALFRQLAAGVPGAYRLFANLLALRAP
jgi:hypothetical protein